MELAKFEAFLKKEEGLEISALVRGTQHLAYPIEGCDLRLLMGCQQSQCNFIFD